MVLNREAVTRRCFVKKWSFKFQKIHRKKPVIESPKGEILAQVFSCEFLRNLKEHLFDRKPLVAASVNTPLNY